MTTPLPTPATPTLPSQVSPPEFALSAAAAHAILGVEVVALPVVPAQPASGQSTSDQATSGQSTSDQAGGAVLLGPGAEELSEALGVDLLELLEQQQATGRTGEITSFPVLARGSLENEQLRTVLLVGVGEQQPVDFRRAGAALARATRDRSSLATTLPAIAPAGSLEAFVVGAMLGSFVFHWRSEGPEYHPVGRIVLAGLPDADGDERRLELDRALAVGGAGWRARVLATVPSNLKNPAWLADQARLAADEAGLEITVLDETELAAEGFGGIVAVGQASATPPRLIRLDYTPAGADRRTPRVVLVGKGITFDTGGLSIKPGEGMVNMKRDMTGGAVVISVLAALADVGCPVRVTGLIAAAENAVSGNALRPGDVIRHYGGRTSEVTNTDAEGRLVMADALAFAARELKPAALVDIATLTGAMKVALGLRTGGFFANDEALAASIREAGEVSGETLWRMPLVADYEEKLASKVADADNAAGGAGAITAALFLQHFTGDVPWAHLDVASVGDAPADLHEWTAGPTGFGARALLAWLGRPDPLAGLS